MHVVRSKAGCITIDELDLVTIDDQFNSFRTTHSVYRASKISAPVSATVYRYSAPYTCGMAAEL